MVNIAIIGLGDMGLGHLKGFDVLENVRIAAICDINEVSVQNALGFLHNNKPEIFTNYKDVLRESSVDAVVIAVPGYLHDEILLECIKADKHVLLEKPVAINYERFKRVKEAAEKSTNVIQVGLVYRYSRLYRDIAHKLNNEKQLDDVTLAWCKEFRQCFPQEPWFYDKSKSGGTIVEKTVIILIFSIG